MSYALIIPARFESSRFPGKPLLDLKGLPMVVRTYEQCAKVVDKGLIYVATDDDRIVSVCAQHGIQTLRTSKQCLTGTDRVAECANKLNVDTYINVQGDEPVFNPCDIELLIDGMWRYPNKILNGVCPIQDEAHFRSVSVPKVVMREDDTLLYMSRSPIPMGKDQNFVNGWRQVCAYVFPRDALLTFSLRSEKTRLEKIEDIEILRFLELGFDVQMIRMSDKSIPIDHQDDVPAVLAAIEARGL